MTQVMSPPCERCGGIVPPNALACVRCGHPLHRAELERLSREATALEPHDPAGAMLRWQQCLRLLPPESPQYAAIYHHLAARAAVPPEDSPTDAFVKTFGSMLLSIIVYAGLVMVYFDYPLIAAFMMSTGLVVLILIHELGHVIAMRYYGLSAGTPLFVPFVGALINMRQLPPNAKVEAIVGIGGPIAGTVGALACYALALALPHGTPAQALTYAGIFLNLFNLLPVPPLDGGRVTAALSPKIWLLGVAALVGLIIKLTMDGQTPFLLILVLVFALPRVLATVRRRTADNPYYQVSKPATWIIGVVYIALAALLTGMWWITHQALNNLA